MFSQILSGNLVSDATYNKSESEKSAINFTVAINFNTDHVEYKDFVYWIKTTEEPKILEYLKKGSKVVVKSDFFKTSSYTDKENVLRYRTQYYVADLDFVSTNKS